MFTTYSAHYSDPNHGAFHEELDASASLPIRCLASQRHRRASLRHVRHRSHHVMISPLSSPQPRLLRSRAQDRSLQPGLRRPPPPQHPRQSQPILHAPLPHYRTHSRGFRPRPTARSLRSCNRSRRPARSLCSRSRIFYQKARRFRTLRSPR